MKLEQDYATAWLCLRQARDMTPLEAEQQLAFSDPSSFKHSTIHFCVE
jgi:hypothetical protein